MTLTDLLAKDGFSCPCGKKHFAGLKDAIIEKGAVKRLPELIKKYGGTRAYVIGDGNTLKAGAAALDCVDVPYTLHAFGSEPLEPDERAVGSAVLHFDHSCDIIIGIGSGVINDIGKIVSAMTGLPYIIVGTAPSMDGYASASSSMARDGLKVSINSRCPDAVVADLDIICAAPEHMLAAGVGDMIAKYVSICEWRIAHLILDEYYCPVVADMVREALHKVVSLAPALLKRDPEAVAAVMEGMIMSGISMNYAGVSRPASGIEHYFSHIWDMRGLEFGTQVDMHGIQVGVAVLYSIRAYDYLRTLTPDRDKALAFVKNFSFDKYCEFIRETMGSAAESMIAGELREHKYDPAKHAVRLERIIANWDEIIKIADEELPAVSEMETLLRQIGAPVSANEFGVSDEMVKKAFVLTKDIRDKYVLSRLFWDIGELDSATENIL